MTGSRLPALDLARGIALIGMGVFHFVFDLEYFGALPRGTVMQPFWMVFARLVAGSFVFLAGVSLVLAHGQGIRWQPFLRGTGLVSLAALAVSAATFLAMPAFFVFFGILHMIVLGRVLGLAVLRAPVWGLVGLAAVVWWAGLALSHAAFDTRWLAWIGFSQTQPPSVDLEPLFPWFAPFLLGMAAARLGLVPRWQGGGVLVWAGRHSLSIYLIHQPVLLGLLWLVLL